MNKNSTLFIHCKIGPHFVHKGFTESIGANIVPYSNKIGEKNILLLLLVSFFRGYIYSKKGYKYIISEGMEGIYFAAFIKVFNKDIKVIYHDADSFFFSDYPNIKGFKKIIIDYFLNKVDYTISVSEISKKYITRYIKKPNTIVSPFVKVGNFEFKPNYNSKNIIFVGRFAEEKNLLNLLKAYKILKEKDKKITLTLIGKGDKKNEILNFIIENQLKDIEIIDRTDKLNKYLHKSIIGYNVSVFEPFGCTGLEYTLSGLFPILGEYNGNSDTFENKDFISKNSPNSITKKILHFINLTTYEKEKILSKAKTEANKYTKEKQEEKFRKEFRKLIKKNEQ